ncbi:hypothetical protein Aau02nite_23000 [Amorphoplanes auranticolor]|uniref:Uncharacterized protein n=1 Tax=Actinoplanes auranticolor TaxID=47988 RepID=A0A919S9W0_9ACTN|nr:hypothetical protein Aau02nite_23000 [Actinoplanes auranticolor]
MEALQKCPIGRQRGIRSDTQYGSRRLRSQSRDAPSQPAGHASRNRDEPTSCQTNVTTPPWSRTHQAVPRTNRGMSVRRWAWGCRRWLGHSGGTSSEQVDFM